MGQNRYVKNISHMAFSKVLCFVFDGLNVGFLLGIHVREEFHQKNSQKRTTSDYFLFSLIVKPMASLETP